MRLVERPRMDTPGRIGDADPDSAPWLHGLQIGYGALFLLGLEGIPINDNAYSSDLKGLGDSLRSIV